MKLKNLKPLFLLLSLGAVVDGKPMASCESQGNCVSLSVKEETDGTCGDTCLFKVCLKIEYSGDCEKDGTVSHVCEKPADNAGTCSAATGFAGALEVADVSSGYSSCQLVAPGHFAEFLVKDGNGCSSGGDSTKSFEGNTAKCSPRDGSTSSCTGNGEGKECVWTVPVPAGCSTTPTEGPTAGPTDPPTEPPTGGDPTDPPTEPPTKPGAQGDPHFNTWNGEKYDFHGACDLVLLHNPGFVDETGLDIHIRTTKVEQVFSYISAAVVKIGDDTLEVSGDTERASYWINGAAGKDMTEDTLLSQTIAGYPIKYRVIDDENRDFLIHLGQNGTVALTTWNGYVGVDIYDANEENFGSSVGLLGTYKGSRVGRNNKVIEDFNEFGEEWQVLETEPKLFHTAVRPQHPEKCSVPSGAEQSRRRLSQSSIQYEDAERACAGVSDGSRDNCVFDIMATSNLKMAHAYR